MNIAMRYRDRIDASTLMPQVDWRNASNDRKVLAAPSVVAIAS